MLKPPPSSADTTSEAAARNPGGGLLHDAPAADRQAAAARRLWRKAGPAGRLLLRRWARHWLQLRAPVAVPVQGAWMVLPSCPISRTILLTEGHEPDEASFLSLLRPGMTVLDVGANLGLYSVLAAMRVGPTGSVHAFEPVPQLCDCIEASADRSGFTNVRVNSAAVGAEASTLALSISESIYGAGHTLGARRADRPTIEVPCLTLDGYLEEQGLRRVDAIKIDVEGAELPAFRGAKGLLSREDGPLIQCEIGDGLCKRMGYRPPALKRLLERLGYRGYRRQGAGAWRRVHPDDIHRPPENVYFFKACHRALVPEEWGLDWS